MVSNLNIVKKKFGKGARKIFLVQQVHSNKVIFVSKNYKDFNRKIKADAIITNQTKLPIAVLTADCVPIF